MKPYVEMIKFNPGTITPDDLTKLRYDFSVLLKQIPLKDRIPFVKSFYEEISHTEQYEVKDVKKSELTIQKLLYSNAKRYHVSIVYGPIPGIGENEDISLAGAQYIDRLERMKRSIDDHRIFFSEKYNELTKLVDSFPNRKAIKIEVFLSESNEWSFDFKGLNDENIASLKLNIADLYVSDSFLCESSYYVNRALTLLTTANALTVNKLQFIRNQVEDAIASSLSSLSSDINEGKKTLSEIDQAIIQLQTTPSP